MLFFALPRILFGQCEICLKAAQFLAPSLHGDVKWCPFLGESQRWPGPPPVVDGRERLGPHPGGQGGDISA